MFKLPKLTKPRQKINVLIATLFMAVQLPVALFAFQTVGAAATGDASTPTSTGGITPVLYVAGDNYPGGNVSCSQLGYNSGSTRNNYNADNNSFADAWPAGISVTVTDDTYVAWTSTFGIGAVIVKGGPNANVYTYNPASMADLGLASPFNSNSEQPYGLSNLTFCYNITRTGSVKIVKDVKDGTDPQDFTFTGGPVSDPDQDSFQLDDDNDQTLENSKSYPSLVPGEYTVTETAVLGWDVSVSCTDTEEDVTNDGRTATFTLEAGDDVVCTFVNDKDPETGSITIVKDARPNDAMNFIFSVTGDGVSNFELDDDGETSILSNSKLHDNLPAGEYSFTETEVEGWTLESITCSTTEGVVIDSPKVTITLGEGDDVTCTFVNVLDEEEGNVLSDTTTSGQVLAAQVVAPVGGVGAGAAAGSITGSLVGLGTSLMTLGYGVASLRKKQ